MTVIAEKLSPSGNVEYTLERLDDKSIVLTVASVHGWHMERTSYYPHVWQWVAESLGYVREPSATNDPLLQQYADLVQRMIDSSGSLRQSGMEQEAIALWTAWHNA